MREINNRISKLEISVAACRRETDKKKEVSLCKLQVKEAMMSFNSCTVVGGVHMCLERKSDNALSVRAGRFRISAGVKRWEGVLRRKESKLHFLS